MGEAPRADTIPVSEPVELRPTSVRWRITALLMLYVAVNHFNRISMSVAGTEHILEEYRGVISETQMGMVYSAFLFAYTAFMTPGGWVIDRVGARRALLGVGLGSAVFVFLTGVAGFLWKDATALLAALVLVRACAGMFSAPIHPAGAHVVSRWMPVPSRSWANGLVNGSALFGIACTYTVFGLLTEVAGWPLPFLLAGAVTAAVAAAWKWYATEVPAGHSGVNVAELRLIAGAAGEDKRATGTVSGGEDSIRPLDSTEPEQPSLFPRSSLLNNRSLMMLTLSYVAVGYFEFMLMYWVQHYFFKQLEFSKADSRLYSTACNLAMGCGMFAGGWLSGRCEKLLGQRRGRAAVPVAAMLGGALFLGIGVACKGQPLASVAYVAMAMAAAGACEGPFWTTAVELGGRRGGTSAAIFNTGGNVGGLVAPTLTPFLSQFIGWDMALGLAGVLCVLGAGVWWWVDPAERVPEMN